MNDYRVFKERGQYKALRHKHNRNDCILIGGDFVMAKGNHDFINRLFFTFASHAE